MKLLKIIREIRIKPVTPEMVDDLDANIYELDKRNNINFDLWNRRRAILDKYIPNYLSKENQNATILHSLRQISSNDLNKMFYELLELHDEYKKLDLDEIKNVHNATFEEIDALDDKIAWAREINLTNDRMTIYDQIEQIWPEGDIILSGSFSSYLKAMPQNIKNVLYVKLKELAQKVPS